MQMTKIAPVCPYRFPEKSLSPPFFSDFCQIKLGVAPGRVIRDIDAWLAEDHGSGDISVFAGLRRNPVVSFFIVAKQDFVLAGLPLMCQTFWQTAHPDTLSLFSDVCDGDTVQKGSVVLAGKGPAAAILLAERAALNLSSHISGVASKTASVLASLARHSSTACLLETRKTTPGLRMYEKYATRLAGARNHRHGLDGGAMLKENHLRVAGSLEDPIGRLGRHVPVLSKIEVEVTNFSEFQTVLEQPAVNVIMLDNFSLAEAKKAVSLRNAQAPHVQLELSGNLDTQDVAELASLGVDFLSMGALVHKAVWVDISLQIYALDS